MGKINVIRSGVILAGLVAYSNAAVADDALIKTQPCLEIQANHERLACYDEAAKQLGLNAVAGTVSGDQGNWSIRNWRSPIDDSQNVIATLHADDTVPNTIGTRQVTPTLSLRCKEGKLDAFIDWQRYLSTQPLTQVIRFDSSQAYNQEWSISTDHEALFAYGGQISDFIVKTMISTSLYIQVTPYGENPVGVNFYLKGSRVATLNVLKACS